MEQKSPDAFRTISEVAEWLGVPTHVLRFWESRFTQVKPVKRAGGRRYYRPADMLLLGGIRKLLHEDGLTIRGVQKLLREQGVKHVAAMSPPVDSEPATESNVVSLDAGRSEDAAATNDTDTDSGEADATASDPTEHDDGTPVESVDSPSAEPAPTPETTEDGPSADIDYPKPTEASDLAGGGEDEASDDTTDRASFHTEVSEADDSDIASQPPAPVAQDTLPDTALETTRGDVGDAADVPDRDETNKADEVAETATSAEDDEPSDSVDEPSSKTETRDDTGLPEDVAQADGEADDAPLEPETEGDAQVMPETDPESTKQPDAVAELERVALTMPAIGEDPQDETLDPKIEPVAPILRRMRARGLTLPPATLQALADRLETLTRGSSTTPPPGGLG